MLKLPVSSFCLKKLYFIHVQYCTRGVFIVCLYIFIVISRTIKHFLMNLFYIQYFYYTVMFLKKVLVKIPQRKLYRTKPINTGCPRYSYLFLKVVFDTFIHQKAEISTADRQNRLLQRSIKKLHANMNCSLQEAHKGTIVISVHAHSTTSQKKIVSDLGEIF